jgi:uncharacterized protein (TIGR00369 family)
MVKITSDEFLALIGETMPMVARMAPEIVALGEGAATIRLPPHPDNLRPGGTISGPILMLLADLAVYAALLGAIGKVELAVTTNLTINFLRKPPLAALTAEARLLKLGRRLAVGEVGLRGAGEPDLLAHAVATYAARLRAAAAGATLGPMPLSWGVYPLPVIEPANRRGQARRGGRRHRRDRLSEGQAAQGVEARRGARCNAPAAPGACLLIYGAAPL